ncbi:hypothetical protein Emag_007388 [Eimeria magna]
MAMRPESDVVGESAERGQTRVVAQERNNLTTVALEDQGMTGQADRDLVLVKEIDAQKSGKGHARNHEERRRGLERTQANVEGDAA